MLNKYIGRVFTCGLLLDGTVGFFKRDLSLWFEAEHYPWQRTKWLLHSGLKRGLHWHIID